ncbi:MAG: type II secretion system major pseudopilin GspG [Myxococcota bacterium]
MSDPKLRQRSAAADRGFTLMEILVVVVIIGMLMTLVGSRLFSRLDETKITIANSKLQKVAQQLELYKLDNGRYPTTSQGLVALVREPTEDPLPRRYAVAGYLRNADLADPWGVAYEYEQPGTHNSYSYDLFSLGPDGQPGEDDVTNWDETADAP